MRRIASDIAARYTVWCSWPSSPDRYRTTVVQTTESAARNSVEALLDMSFAVQLDMEFFDVSHPNDLIGRVCAVRWDKYGRVTERYVGALQKYMPPWVDGTEMVRRDQSAVRTRSSPRNRSPRTPRDQG